MGTTWHNQQTEFHPHVTHIYMCVCVERDRDKFTSLKKNANVINNTNKGA